MVGIVVTGENSSCFQATAAPQLQLLVFLILLSLKKKPEIWLLIENHVIPLSSHPSVQSVFIGCLLCARPAGGAEDITE